MSGTSSKPTIPGFLGFLQQSLEVAERVEKLGPIGVGTMAWEALPQATKEKVLGQVCEDCGAPQSRCECCDICGWTPCACPEKFPRETIEVEGEAVE